MPLTRSPSLDAAAAEAAAGQEEADEELVRRAALGNADAFGTLVLRYQDRVFNLLARFCSSADEAEDLAQETFLKAYRALGAFRSGSKFYTWLFRIAMNAAFSRRRHDARHKRFEAVRLDAPSDPAGEVQGLRDVVAAPADCDPAVELEKQQLRERVQEGLQQLDPDYRSILLLRDVEGLDYDAIADTLSVSRAAVKSRLHRARLELARVLKDLQ
ncbi:MAG: sigma-70 family RNA polymerase sigma factor [Planctomycetota bacterium]